MGCNSSKPKAVSPPSPPKRVVEEREIEVDGMWYRDTHETVVAQDGTSKTTTETHTRSISVEDQEVRVTRETPNGGSKTSVTVRGGLRPEEAAHFDQEWGVDWRPEGVRGAATVSQQVYFVHEDDFVP